MRDSQSFPTRVYSEAGSTEAMAYASRTVSSDTKAVLVSGYLKPDPAYRGVIGLFASSDPNAWMDRVISLEVDNTGIWANAKDGNGNSWGRQITTSVTSGQEYYLQVYYLQMGGGTSFRATTCAWKAGAEFYGCIHSPEQTLWFKWPQGMTMYSGIGAWGASGSPSNYWISTSYRPSEEWG